MSEPTTKPPTDWNAVVRNPYFAIGLVFLAVSVTFFVNDSMRTMGFAFLPLGIVFMSLAMSGTGGEKAQDAASEPDRPPAEPGEPDSPAPTDRP